MSGNLAGKIALVTGGSRGIGAAIAERLAREGAHVALTYVSNVKRAQEVAQKLMKYGVKALALKADSRNPDELREVIAQTADNFGGIDILINNAGILRIGTIDEISLEDFDQTVAVNVRAVLVATQAATKHMVEGGRVINIGSINAERMPMPGGSVYAMSKAALVGLTKGLARDLAPKGITINNVQLGPVDTDMNPADGDLAQVCLPLMAVDHYAQGSDIASFVSYLASSESGYITGASLNIDGGFTA
jgi:3-oxoacyl-[acyl-carrier protein] reductase